MEFSFARAAVLTFGTAAALNPAWAADGKAVYEQACSLCHATGVANAPRLGDKVAWAPRLATGKQALLASALKGKGVMPARGGASGLKDGDLRAAVEFMLAAVN